MTPDSDALNWDGDEDAPPHRPEPEKVPRTAPPVTVPPPADGGDLDRQESEEAETEALDADGDAELDERAPLSAAMLLVAGVVGGIFLLYSAGWVAGGLRLKPLANLIVADAMYVPWFVLAVAAPALWFLAVWVLTRGRASWVRIGLLFLGVVLLVPWPFVTVGVVGV
ncbi:hypothetical protein [Microbacterium sp. 3J1]|uniref:hypothetical protein n=1 Tax=Microbacterium sp. 3J1 TaxID=861269 RepID=UPI0021001BCC|nr:hypothetical protein [Microbacterium sp. 3J1]